MTPATQTDASSETPNAGISGNSIASLEIIPTGAAVGAEIRGIDLSRPLPGAVATALQEAWSKHLVLLFRDQEMTPEQHLRAASIFGKPQVGAARAYFEKTGKMDTLHTLPAPEIAVLSNLDQEGNPVKENAGLGSLEVVWHSDNSYIDQPPAGSTLYAREIPDDGTGKTSFNKQYLAYEELPDDLRRAIDGRCTKQDASRNSAGVLRPGVKEPENPRTFQVPCTRSSASIQRPAGKPSTSDGGGSGLRSSSRGFRMSKARNCSTNFGRMQRKKNMPGRMSGVLAICWYGTIDARCTIASRSTPISVESCGAASLKAIA